MKLGFVGQMRAGKDTAADYLKKTLGGRILKFADPLYWIHDHALEVCLLPKEKDRLLLQVLGTEWGRTKDPDMWVKILFRRLKKMEEEENYTGNIFVTDVRFENEVNILRENGFKIVQVVSDNRIERGATLETHVSEEFARSFDSPDILLENNHTLATFFELIDSKIPELQC